MEKPGRLFQGFPGVKTFRKNFYRTRLRIAKFLLYKGAAAAGGIGSF
jgi:hypothetical protein